MEMTRLALSAAHRYRAGRHGLNLGDCLHYACAKFYGVPILATADEFRQTDLETVL
jgi:ribonuclease VapC